MKKAFFLFSILSIIISCSDHQLSDKTDKPSFEINKLSFDVNQPLTISGINRYKLDTFVIKKNHIKQFICYEEHQEVRLFLSTKTEWKMIESCTFDTTGNWVQYKMYDQYGISDYTLINELKNKSDTTDKIKKYWIKNEYFIKSDSFFYYARFNVKDGVGYLVYDSTNSTFKNFSENSANIYHGDTVISKSKNQVIGKTIFSRNKNGQIIQIQNIDNRGLYEITTYEYINGFVSKSIRQNLVDMTTSIYIDIIEYNEMLLPINFKCYSLDNSKTALEEYNSGSKKAEKISEIKVDWIN